MQLGNALLMEMKENFLKEKRVKELSFLSDICYEASNYRLKMDEKEVFLDHIRTFLLKTTMV